MSEQSKTQETQGGAPFELTSDEARYFRRFFHRMALPYAAGAGALLAVAIAFPQVLGSHPSPEPQTPIVIPAEPAEPVYGRAEVQSLVLELLDARGDTAGAEAASRNEALVGRIAGLEKALGSAQKRLRSLDSERSRKDQGDAPLARQISDRVHNTENRVEQLEARAEAAEKARSTSATATLDRLYNLEQFRTELEAKKDDDLSFLLHRLDAIESRLKTLED